MHYTRQFWALLHLSLTNIPQRLGLVLTIVVGVACAVGVLVSMLAMGEGARREAMGNVRPDRVILMSVGAQRPFQSNIPKNDLPVILTMPGIRRSDDDTPIAGAQALLTIQARTKDTGTPLRFALTGVTPGLTEYQPELRLTAGRMFNPGLRELVASTKCTQQFVDFQVGDKRVMRGAEWVVVGNFALGESEGVCAVFADAETALAAFGRDRYNQVTAILESPSALTQLNDALKANSTLRVEARYEAELIEEGTRSFNGILDFAAYFIGTIMAFAATFGAANSLFSIADSRRRELATLRAMGFSSWPVIASMLVESILLALPGAMIGVAGAWYLFNGFTVRPGGVSFPLAVTVPIAALGVGWALAIGLIGGLLPALKAARVPVTTALRAT